MRPPAHCLAAAWFAVALMLTTHAARSSGAQSPDALFTSRLKLLLATPLPGVDAVIDLPTLPRLPDGSLAPSGFLTLSGDATPEAFAGQTAKAEQASTNAEDFALISRMRAASDAGAAAAIGAALPAELCLYTQGAIAFAHDDYTAARAAFTAVLALPADQARRRAAWSAFMLGRLDTQDQKNDSGITQFRAVRALVKAGAADGLDLAALSLGAEARLEIRRNNFGDALHLYKQESTSGLQDPNSFTTLAQKAFSQPQTFPADIADPNLRTLLIRYAAIVVAPDYKDHAYDPVYEPPLDRFFAAIAASPRPDDPMALLAVIAYHIGNYAAAASFADKAAPPFSFWVQAKLAVHNGNMKDASDLYAKAMRTGKMSPQGDEISLESGVLLVTQADFAQAMQAIWPAVSNVWYNEDTPQKNVGATMADANYLAERILTIAELKAFIDSTVPAAPADSKRGTAGDRRNAFRGLLGRRLVRSARFDEALPYFADLDMRALVVDLRNEFGAIAASSGIVKAEHAWNAAKLLRDQGMDLTGTEEWPDFHESGGWFTFPDYTWDSDDPSIKLPQGATSQEAERVRQSAPDPDKRFHYRYVAFRLMTRAADNLPAKSQAYAAILCQSAQLMFRTHEETAAVETWRRYIHTGAYISTLHPFGRNCPVPDFAGAHHTSARLFRVALHHWIHCWKYALLAAGPFVGAMFLLQRWAVRRKSRSTTI